MKLRVVALSAALALWMTGCADSATPPSSSLSVTDAKAAAIALGDDAVDLLPEDVIADVFEDDSSKLIHCSEDDLYRWPGSSIVTLHETTDTNTLIGAIADAFAKREDVASSSIDQPDGGEDRLTAITDDGAIVIVSRQNDEGTGLRISTYSPCVQLSETENPFDEY